MLDYQENAKRLVPTTTADYTGSKLDLSLESVIQDDVGLRVEGRTASVVVWQEFEQTSVQEQQVSVGRQERTGSRHGGTTRCH